MSASHHQRSPDEQELFKRFLDQVNRTPNRAYSQGRIAPDDDGDLAIAVAADPDHRTIIIRFGKPTEWIGMSADHARHLITLLQDEINFLEAPKP
jgi:hypothetical protein